MNDLVEVADRFPCQTCGADMRFDPGHDRLNCDHCGATAPLETGRAKLREMDFQAASTLGLGDADFAEQQAFSCENCGASVVFDADAHAMECPFCASPVVADTSKSRQIKPRGLVPFALGEEQARDKMATWLGKLWFAPNGLAKYAKKGRRLRGVYVPFWTYDADTKSRYSGQRGTYYTVTQRVQVTVDGKTKWENREVQKIRWTNASGRVARFFDDVLILASKSLPKEHTDALAPWDLSDLRNYGPSFMAGFEAQSYNVTLDDGYLEAQAYMARRIERDVRDSIGGDQQRIDSVNTKTSDVTFKHILLPVWVAAYKFRGKSFRFVVNGQNGNVSGERPYSVWKITFAILTVLVVALIIGAIVAANG
jgi:DNA-directed RNA polymerase subunit RPC12/RpoP